MGGLALSRRSAGCESPRHCLDRAQRRRSRIASSGIAEFLKFETAAGILFEPGESAEEALDALQLPRHLRRQPTPYDELAEWADPTLGARNHWQDRAQLHLTSITEAVQSLIASCASDL